MKKLHIIGTVESIETFFKSNSQQKAMFDEAIKLEASLVNEKEYFINEPELNSKIDEIKEILTMVKPYNRIKDLADLMQTVRNAYKVMLDLKRDEVMGMITQCMGDVHTLADVGNAKDFVKKADEQFMDYKQKASEADSLTVLDAMITRLLNYKDTACKHLEAILHKPDTPDGKPTPKLKIAQIRRYDMFPVKRLQTREDVDSYLEGIKKKLYETLEDNDGVQLN